MSRPRAVFASACLCAVLLAPAVPAALAAEGTAVKAPFAARIIPSFLRGAEFYGDLVGRWLASLLKLVGLAGGAAGDAGPCDERLRCPRGANCTNVCADESCDVYEKRCLRAAPGIIVLAEYAPCGPSNVCVQGTMCRRTCPAGAACPVMHRCLKEDVSAGACADAPQCAEACARRGFAPIGTAAWAARCEAGTCRCKLEEFDPEAPISACAAASDVAYACPAGSRAACTGGRPTCLKDPAFGGQCLDDAECSQVGCTDDAEPFCDSDRRCRCRSIRAETVACAADADCAAIPCEAGQTQACVAGACACAVMEEAPPSTACRSAADCAECAQGYTSACERGACVCQRTIESGPVPCATAADCGAVACPAGYDKACLESKCACTRPATE